MIKPSTVRRLVEREVSVMVALNVDSEFKSCCNFFGRHPSNLSFVLAKPTLLYWVVRRNHDLGGGAMLCGGCVEHLICICISIF